MAMKAYGGGLGRSGTLRIGHENLILRTLLPYLAMMMGMAMALAFAFVMRVYMYWFGYEGVLGDTFIASGIVLLSAGILCWCSWRFFGQRKAIDIKEHATLTTGIAHVWMLCALWSDLGSWVWSGSVLVLWTFGSIIVGLTWCIRRWAQNGEDTGGGRDDNTKTTLEKIGLGESYWRGKPVIEGEIAVAELALAPGKTTADVKRVRSELAGIAGLPVDQVHVSDVESGRADRASVTFVKTSPFKRHVPWAGVELPGASIGESIHFGTYENAARAGITLSGHRGGSLQHWQWMGMSGVGKSKLAQIVLGNAVCRCDVNLIGLDPIKGVQTFEPLGVGLAIFAVGMDECARVIARLNHVITVRTDYLTSKGLSHWEPGCGIKFEIIHIEEFARFNKMNVIIELVEAARSAGIMFSLSLQRASSTRQKTDIRFNLGGSFCFGVHDASDARMALSEYTIESGAVPHHWQDRFPGRFYLEGHGIDPRMFAMPVMADWVDIEDVRSEVDRYGSSSRIMDDVSAEAWGDVYTRYQDAYAAGTHGWQQLRQGRSAAGTGGTECRSVDVDGGTGDGGAVAKPDGNARTYTITKVDAEALVWMWLRAKRKAGVEVVSFTEIRNDVLASTERSEGWLSSYLSGCVNAGLMPRHARRGFYYTPEACAKDTQI